MFYGVITHQRVIPQWKTRVTWVLRVQSYDLRERRSILTCGYFALSRLDLFTFSRIDSFSLRIFVPNRSYYFKNSYFQNRHSRGISPKVDVFPINLLRNTNGIPHKLYNNKAFEALHQTKGTRWVATNRRNILPQSPNSHQRWGNRTAILLPSLDNRRTVPKDFGAMKEARKPTTQRFEKLWRKCRGIVGMFTQKLQAWEKTSKRRAQKNVRL